MREPRQPAGGWTFGLLEGEAALERLRSPAFQEKWRRLADRDPKPTWYQEPAFVLPWYESYRRGYEPILCLATRDGGRLAGLLPVARDRSDSELVHAGAHQANYHGWLARPDLQGDFPRHCIEELFRRHRPRRWRWRTLPHGAPVDWARSGFARGSLAGARFEVERTPIWNLEDDEILERILGQASLRNYINRLERQGELRLDEVTDPGEAERLLALLVDWCDLRHGAIHGDLPFRDDPAKLDFHRRLATGDPSVLMSVLRVGDRPLAIHLGAFDGRRLILGLHGYDPAQGRLSPGTILMVELAKEIRRRGGTELDLTPGGDAWKERYASHHAEAVRVVFYRDRLDLLGCGMAEGIADAARRLIEATGREPREVKERALQAIGSWRGRSGDRPGDTAGHDASSILEVPCEAASREAAEHEDDPLPALLAFDRTHSREMSRTFLYAGLKLLEKGWRCFPQRRDGRLAAMVWLQPAGARYDLSADDDGEPRLDAVSVSGARFQGSREGSGVVPEDTYVAVVCHERRETADLDPGPLLSGVLHQAAHDGARRVWFVHRAAHRRIRRWLATATPEGRSVRAA